MQNISFLANIWIFDFLNPIVLSFCVGTHAWMSAQSMSFSDVSVRTKLRKECGGQIKVFLAKNLLDVMLKGKMVKLILGGPRGRCT